MAAGGASQSVDPAVLREQKERLLAFFTAAKDGDERALKVSLESFEAARDGGAKAAVLGMRDAHRRTALHFAANQGHSGCIRIMLEHCKDAANAADEDGATPLIMAVLGRAPGAIDCVETLIEFGADVNARREREMDTALHIASRNGFMPAVERLLAASADPTLHSVVGTALHEAAAEGETAAVNAIIKSVGSHPAWLSVPGPRSATPLLLAATAGHEDASVALIRAGSPVAAHATKGETALHIFADNGHHGAVAAALEHAKDAEAAARKPDDAGLLPVQRALLKGHSSVAELLWGASKDSCDAESLDSLSAATSAAAVPSGAGAAGDSASAAAAAASGAEDAKAAAVSAREQAACATVEEEAKAADAFENDGSATAEADAEAALAKKAEGNAAFGKKQYSKAEGAYSEGVALDPRNAALRMNRSAARLRQGNNLGALADAVMARKLDATLAKAYFREGSARMALRQWEEAANVFFDGLKLSDVPEMRDGFQEAVRRGKADHAKLEKAKLAQEEEIRIEAVRAEKRLRRALERKA
ncbi:hypothetical protein FNF27_01903 [Cafeteria roenbergensis]|uniref:Uncharacterized protein n=1 Tax=Cafeteria roenbergensis TaxID=33653 RepID=A0A5A8EGH7_CAFRO|nr:hypothetical protein FNF31_00116 [Cafeteria roenbergensis]KAA0176622.1 hypothetical protein FNF27_01903 [Cafeteria roenbergensis]